MPKHRAKPKPKPRSLIPILMMVGGLVVLLVTGWAIFNSNSQPKADIVVKGAPRLKVEKDVIDRGDLKLGNVIQDNVRVTNIGDQPLRFTEAPYVEVVEGC